ncbi:hypothetical protein [Streptomyces zingiberis]|uniref:Secreted protein n=1 Tax=Streptomyces zingiberis TaxID=2053010 RepID=A0ABX1BTY9_9ACTN|nr:hypothetical protein [Streptomyces zingiberis]
MPWLPVPPPALCGFLLLLVLAFTVSYAVGSASGPVAPGMHRPGTGGGAENGGTENGGMEEHTRHGGGG